MMTPTETSGSYDPAPVSKTTGRPAGDNPFSAAYAAAFDFLGNTSPLMVVFAVVSAVGFAVSSFFMSLVSSMDLPGFAVWSIFAIGSLFQILTVAWFVWFVVDLWRAAIGKSDLARQS